MLKKILYPVLFFLLTVSSQAQQLKLDINGTITFNSSDYMIKEAGKDFPSTINSASNIQLSISFINFWDKFFDSGKKWKIYVSKSDINWNQNINIEIARVGEGTSFRNGKRERIIGGTQFQPILNTPVYFFRGQNEIFNIPVAFKVHGVSVTGGAQEIESVIMFTIYED